MEDINSYILSLKINGIKNIKKEIELSFYNAKITNSFDFSLYNVKAIYGENGVGKSGIVTALNIIKNVALNDKYLNQKINQNLLIDLINKEAKKMYVEVEFLTKIKDAIFIYSYKLVLALKDDKIEILSEQLNERSKNNKTYVDIMNVNYGHIENIRCSNSLAEKIKNKTNNLIFDCSTLSVVFSNDVILDAIKKNQKKDTQFLLAIICTNYLFQHMTILLEQSDMHEDYLIRKYIMKEVKRSKTKNSNEISNIVALMASNRDHYLKQIRVEDNIIAKDDYKIFEKNIKKLTKFIKIFKPELRKITIDRKINTDSYICRLVMKYDRYDINVEYESNGIKKLIKMFNALSSLSKGEIVFIDEIDSNIHDVYLYKLIEYFAKYSKGQLCFTTHNLSPMALLSKRKKGIDFISRDGDVVPWVSNGNRSAIKFYQNGMVDKCPFNLEYFEFLEVFDGE